jgi:uncharacterized protein YvpB
MFLLKTKVLLIGLSDLNNKLPILINIPNFNNKINNFYLRTNNKPLEWPFKRKVLLIINFNNFNKEIYNKRKIRKMKKILPK